MEANQLFTDGANRQYGHRYELEKRQEEITRNIKERGQNIHSSEQKRTLSEQYNERGFIKYLMVDFDEAVEDFTKALELDKESYMALYNRGLIHYRLGRFNEAIMDMENVLLIEPDFQSAKQCLGQAKIDIMNKRD